MSGFGSIVVGVDGSEVAYEALLFAADDASRRGSRLIVAHAWRAAPPGPADAEVEPFPDILRQQVVATIADVHPSLDYEIVQRPADAADLLIDLGRAADLVVVGTHRAGRLRGFVLGSVSQRVAARAGCSVVAVSGAPAHPDGPIVLGASASPGGRAALHFACREAQLRRRPVRAIRSITTETWAVYGDQGEEAPDATALHGAAQSVLDTVLREAGRAYPDVTIDGSVDEVDPFTALLGAAHEAALLVIGSRRGAGTTLPHLGPVAAWLLHQANCPLAIIGEPPATGRT